MKMYNCPNCGAPITGLQCEYCNTVFDLKAFLNKQDIDIYKEPLKKNIDIIGGQKKDYITDYKCQLSESPMHGIEGVLAIDNCGFLEVINSSDYWFDPNTLTIHFKKHNNISIIVLYEKFNFNY